eukprot:INCI4074.10.p2 GENE.INCI4074.10~~INCI4074.10.p2  ORF type:complete len:474 (+),score=71.97 INCI4074.10:130-1551(+)
MSQELRSRHAGADKGRQAAPATEARCKKIGERSEDEADDSDVEDSSKVCEYLSKHVSFRSLGVATVISGALAARSWVAAVDSVLQLNVLGNTVADYASAALVMALIHIALYTVLHSLFKVLRAMVAAHTGVVDESRTAANTPFRRQGIALHMMLVALKHETRPAQSSGFSMEHAANLVITAYLGVSARNIHFGDEITGVFHKTFVAMVVWRGGSIVWRLLEVFLSEVLCTSAWAREHGFDGERGEFLVSYLKPAFWVVVVFTAAENSGMNMGAILSGLGVGGIMLALSAQEMAKDAFASVTMMVDGAFDKGDVISIAGSEDKVGRVAQITPKHTILQTFDGERLVVANRDIANARVRNFGPSGNQRQRVTTSIKLSRKTPRAVLAALTDRIQDALTEISFLEFGAFYLKGFGDWSYDFEFVYYVLAEPNVERPAFTGQNTAHMTLLRVLEDSGVQLASKYDNRTQKSKDVEEK